MTAFTSSSRFWPTFVFIVNGNVGDGADSEFLGSYLFMGGPFAAYVFLNALDKNRALPVVFLTLMIWFWLLAIGHWADHETIIEIAGWEGIICGFSAICPAAAEVFKDTYGNEIPPIGEIE